MVYVVIAGGGLGPDARHRPAPTRSTALRARATARSPASPQTARNFGASLGLAVLGAILVSRNNTNVTGALTKDGVPPRVAHKVARRSASALGSGQSGAGQPHAVVHAVQLAFAHSTQTVFYIMAGVMVTQIQIVAVRGLPLGRSRPRRRWAGAPVGTPETGV